MVFYVNWKFVRFKLKTNPLQFETCLTDFSTNCFINWAQITNMMKNTFCGKCIYKVLKVYPTV